MHRALQLSRTLQSQIQTHQSCAQSAPSKFRHQTQLLLNSKLAEFTNQLNRQLSWVHTTKQEIQTFFSVQIQALVDTNVKMHENIEKRIWRVEGLVRCVRDMRREVKRLQGEEMGGDM